MSIVVGLYLTPQEVEVLQTVEDMPPLTNVLNEQEEREIFTRIEKRELAAAAVIIGSLVPDPITTAQRLYFANKNISVVILSAEENYHGLLSSVQFAPFLGEQVMCVLSGDEQQVKDKLKAAVAATRKRRKYEADIYTMNMHVPGQNSLQIHGARYVDRLLDLAPIGVLMVNKDGKILAWNKRAEEMFEKNERGVLGMSLLDFFPPEEHIRFKNLIAHVLQGRPPSRRVFSRFINKNKKQYLEATASGVGDNDNNVLIILEDITKRKHNEEKLIKSQEQQKFLADSGNILFSSLDYYETLTKVAHLSVPLIADMCIVHIKEGRGVKRLAIAYKDYKHDEIIKTLRDKSESSKAIDAMALEVIKSSRALMYIGTNGKASYAGGKNGNGKHAAYTLEQEFSLSSWMCVPLTFGKSTFGAISFFSSSPDRLYTREDLYLATELGRHAAVAIENARLYKEARDEIAYRRRAEEALRNSEERFRTLIEKSTDAILMVNSDGKVTYISESVKNVLGYTPSELVGKDVTDCMYPGDLEYFYRKFRELLEEPEKPIYLQLRAKHKSGSWAWVEATGVNHLQTPNIQALVGTFRNISERKKAEQELKYQKSLLEAQSEWSPLGILVVSHTGKMVSYNKRFIDMWKIPPELVQKGQDEEALVNASGNLIDPQGFIQTVRQIYKKREKNFEEIHFKDGRVFERHGSPIMGHDGTDYGYIWFFQDITQRKRLERQKDEFISIASHELKTPVTSIKSFAQVLYMRFKKIGNEEAAQLIKKMDAQVDKLTKLIIDLLDVTKVQAGKIQFNEQRFIIDELVEETVEELQRTTEKHRILIKGSTKGEVYVDRERIGQVLTNLIANAIKYSPQSDKIIIHLSSNKQKITVCVEDFGVGIPKEVQEKVFERFFRVPGKDTFPGLGLGLYISSEIVKRSGGEIWVESEEGKGSSFCFTLPVAAQERGHSN